SRDDAVEDRVVEEALTRQLLEGANRVRRVLIVEADRERAFARLDDRVRLDRLAVRVRRVAAAAPGHDDRQQDAGDACFHALIAARARLTSAVAISTL